MQFLQNILTENKNISEIKTRQNNLLKLKTKRTSEKSWPCRLNKKKSKNLKCFPHSKLKGFFAMMLKP